MLARKILAIDHFEKIFDLNILFYFISEEQLVKNRLLTVIPRLSTEWIMSFTIRFVSLSPSSYFCNILHMTKGESNESYGDRTPNLFLPPDRNKFRISSAVNGNKNYAFGTTQSLTIDVPTQIEIHQRYIKRREISIFRQNKR